MLAVYVGVVGVDVFITLDAVGATSDAGVVVAVVGNVTIEVVVAGGGGFANSAFLEMLLVRCSCCCNCECLVMQCYCCR